MNKQKLMVQLGEKTYEVLVSTKKDTQQVEVEIFGKKNYFVSSCAFSKGHMHLLIDGKSEEVYYENIGDAQDPLDGRIQVQLHQKNYVLDVLSETFYQAKQKRKQSSRQTNAGAVKSPMPGKVVRILVEQGQQVEKSQGLIVIEAMKMENELKATHAGVITKLSVKEGDTLQNGAFLMELV